MKRTVALLAALLLTGCAGDGSVDLPETVPAESFSAAAVVMEGRAPAEAWDLPAEVTPIAAWDREHQPVVLLVQTEDAAFYGGCTVSGGEVALIQWGDTLTEFDWAYAAQPALPPQMWSLDADGDGQEELVVTLRRDGGPGLSVQEIHVLEKGGGSLVDHGCPQSLWQDQLSRRLSVQTAGGRVFAVLGRELCDITEEMESLDPQLITGLDTGNSAEFCVESGRILYRGIVRVTAEGYADGWYAAGISAEVFYQDGTFALDRFHLDSLYR